MTVTQDACEPLPRLYVINFSNFVPTTIRHLVRRRSGVVGAAMVGGGRGRGSSPRTSPGSVTRNSSNPAKQQRSMRGPRNPGRSTLSFVFCDQLFCRAIFAGFVAAFVFVAVFVAIGVKVAAGAGAVGSSAVTVGGGRVRVFLSDVSEPAELLDLEELEGVRGVAALSFDVYSVANGKDSEFLPDAYKPFFLPEEESV